MFPVKDIMTKKVIAVKKDTPIYKAIELLAKKKISGLPVVDNENNLVGIITEHDVLHLLTEENIDENFTVDKYMTTNVISFKEDDSAITVCDFLQNKKIRRVPIVKNGKLMGVVSRHDIIKLILSIRKK